jgi:hypothetical protein
MPQWNANGLQSQKEEIKLFFNQNFTDILLLSSIHFTNKNYFSMPRYKLYYTNHPDGTAHGSTAILIKETIERYELLKYEEDSIQATSMKVKGFPCEITITAVYCPPRHNLKKEHFETFSNARTKIYGRRRLQQQTQSMGLTFNNNNKRHRIIKGIQRQKLFISINWNIQHTGLLTETKSRIC